MTCHVTSPSGGARPNVHDHASLLGAALRPDHETNNAFIYCLAVAAEKYGIKVIFTATIICKLPHRPPGTDTALGDISPTIIRVSADEILGLQKDAPARGPRYNAMPAASATQTCFPNATAMP